MEVMKYLWADFKNMSNADRGMSIMLSPMLIVAVPPIFLLWGIAYAIGWMSKKVIP